MDDTKVYLVDDNEAFRKSTAWLLEASGVAVFDFNGGPALLRHLESTPPSATGSCIVSDVRMPEMSGLELFEELRRRQIAVPVIFITAHGDVPLAVEAMRGGAAHFIEKPFDGEALLQAVRAAATEPPARPRAPASDSKLAALTPRERQVLDLVVAGKLNKIIADTLGISIKTVELHRANMMSKLGVRNVPELVRLVLGYA